MLQGKVVINFEYDEEKEKCHTDLKQDGKDRLSKDDLIQLLQHCIGELMSEQVSEFSFLIKITQQFLLSVQILNLVYDIFGKRMLFHLFFMNFQLFLQSNSDFRVPIVNTAEIR